MSEGRELPRSIAYFRHLTVPVGVDLVVNWALPWRRGDGGCGVPLDLKGLTEQTLAAAARANVSGDDANGISGCLFFIIVF